MKKTLFIGSSVADLVMTVDRLPVSAQDVNVLSRSLAPGGCAYNASLAYQQLGGAFTLFSPVGTGLYGDFVRNAMRSRGIEPAITVDDRENGCCLCLVESSGERTFICDHGAEYFFKKEWFDRLDPTEYDSLYICGLEIEESTGNVIIDFAERNPELTIYFAPGPRIMEIDSAKMDRILALHPIMHINELEAAAFATAWCSASSSSLRTDAENCQCIARKTHNICIVTLGIRGACYCDVDDTGAPLAVQTIPGVPAVISDTIGAGDAHVGAVIALYKKGLPLCDAICKANRIASAVVSVKGASLPTNHPVFVAINR